MRIFIAHNSRVMLEKSYDGNYKEREIEYMDNMVAPLRVINVHKNMVEMSRRLRFNHEWDAVVIVVKP